MDAGNKQPDLNTPKPWHFVAAEVLLALSTVVIVLGFLFAACGWLD